MQGSEHDRDMRDPGVDASRRTILQYLGAGAATVVVAGVGVGSYRVFDNGVLDSGRGTPYEPWLHWRGDQTLMGAVATAILAANPHNTQPWIFRVSAESIDLFSDPSRRIGAMDPLEREHHIGLGCALENLVLAADARGLQSTVTLLPSSTDPTHVAHLDLLASNPRSSALYDAVGERHSNRGPYTSTAISPAALDSLTQQAGLTPDLSLRWFTTADERRDLGALVVDATKAVIADTVQSTAAFAWFRNDRADIDAHRDGLTLDCQGLSRPLLTIAKLLPASSRTAGDAFWLDQTRTVHTATAAAYGIITVADTTDPTTRLRAGRALQRIHLGATVAGFGLQHMNQITERIDREAALGVTPAFGSRSDALIDQPNRHAMSTFRIGNPTRTGGLSPRRPVEAVIR